MNYFDNGSREENVQADEEGQQALCLLSDRLSASLSARHPSPGDAAEFKGTDGIAEGHLQVQGAVEKVAQLALFE